METLLAEVELMAKEKEAELSGHGGNGSDALISGAAPLPQSPNKEIPLLKT